jgi:calcineurin-like phosphoesterase
MKPVDCPFRAVEKELGQLDASVKVRIVDFHAEATSDMQVMGRYLDGRASVVLGTHTHVATADERIFPGGTGFQSDIGMTGPFDSILGRKTEAVLEATLHGIPTPFVVATEDVRLNATWFDIDRSTGACLAIGRIEVSESLIAAYNKSVSAK